MPKVTLQEVGAGYSASTDLNANNATLEAAIENTLSRDGTAPNQMGANLDMNSHRVTNLADATNPQDAVTLSQVATLALGGTIGVVSVGAGTGITVDATVPGVPVVAVDPAGAFTSLTVNDVAVSVEGHTHTYLPLAGGTLTGALVTAAAGIEVGHATDTTLTRAAAGIVAVEGLALGYLDMPIVASLTRGKMAVVTAGVTVNTATAGYTFGVYNNSAAAITLTQGAGLTLRLAGGASTGNRTLAERGFATIFYNSASEAIVIGNVT